MWEEHRGLGLLLALSSSGCLGLPRFDSEVDDDSASTDDSATATTTTGPTTGPTTTSPTSTSTSTTTGPTTTSPTSTSTSTSTSTTSPTVTTTPPPPDFGGGYEACQLYGDLITECYGEAQGQESYDFCTEYTMYLQEEMPRCVPVFEAFFVCISVLDCGDLFESGNRCEPILQAFFECTGQ